MDADRSHARMFALADELTRADAGTNRALNETMALVGDRWSLLIVDALLAGPMRFSDLEESIPGLAPNVLSSRLRRLERDGLVSSVAYSARPRRYEYEVTTTGKELAGALRLLTSWGANLAGTESEAPVHRSCGTPLEARWFCPTCDRVADPDQEDAVWL